jgi:hypothetical protein
MERIWPLWDFYYGEYAPDPSRPCHTWGRPMSSDGVMVRHCFAWYEL